MEVFVCLFFSFLQFVSLFLLDFFPLLLMYEKNKEQGPLTAHIGERMTLVTLVFRDSGAEIFQSSLRLMGIQIP